MLSHLFIRFVNNKVNKSKKQIRLTEFIHIPPDREAQRRKGFYPLSLRRSVFAMNLSYKISFIKKKGI
jgi:hypothetical protein